MKLCYVGVLLSGFSLQMACDSASDEQLMMSKAATGSSAIINGSACQNNMANSAVELIVEAQVDFGVFGSYKSRGAICSGTLIAPDVVLTAAHCLDAQSLTQGFGKMTSLSYFVTTETDVNYLENQQAPVRNAVLASGFVAHEKYGLPSAVTNGLENQHDIALVFLSKPLDVPHALVLAPKERAYLTSGRTVLIAGWGKQHESSPKNQSDQGTKQCAYASIQELGDFEMQIGSTDPSARKCFGDSGGPSYLQFEENGQIKTRVIGITSRSYDNELCKKGGIDTRADAFFDWINEHMQKACAKGLRSVCADAGINPGSKAINDEKLEGYALLWWIWSYLVLGWNA